MACRGNILVGRCRSVAGFGHPLHTHYDPTDQQTVVEPRAGQAVSTNSSLAHTLGRIARREKRPQCSRPLAIPLPRRLHKIRVTVLDLVYQCCKALLERSGQPGFQILRIQPGVRPGDGNDRDVDVWKDVGWGAKNHGRTQQENEDRKNNERIWAVMGGYGRLRANLTIHMDTFAWLRRSSERFDIAAHISSSFRSSPKPERRFPRRSFRPSLGSMQYATARSHCYLLARFIASLDLGAVAD